MRARKCLSQSAECCHQTEEVDGTARELAIGRLLIVLIFAGFGCDESIRTDSNTLVWFLEADT
jgi:hypothetical protein